MSEKSKQHYQEKSVKDCDNHKYDPPLDLITEIGADEKQREDNKAYHDEWRNHKDQTS